MECLLNEPNKEFSIGQLLDNLQTVIEILKERETAVTPELVHTLNVVILFIKNGGMGNIIKQDIKAIDDLLEQMIKDFFGEKK